MSVKIAVTDANIFIDLCDLELTQSFFNLQLEIHTSTAVIHELYAEQKAILHMYQLNGRLQVHNLQGQELIEIDNQNYPKSLSIADKTVLHIANKIHACVLSSDKVVRSYAKNKEIEYHGMIWIFDNFVDTLTLTPQEASTKLNQLIASNFHFRNNQKLVIEIEKRLKLWK